MSLRFVTLISCSLLIAGCSGAAEGTKHDGAGGLDAGPVPDADGGSADTGTEPADTSPQPAADASTEPALDSGPGVDAGSGWDGSCSENCVLGDLPLVRVSSGTFMMGTPRNEVGWLGPENPVHEVTISRPFWIATTEVTQAQYLRLMGRNPSHFADCGAACPVDQTSWGDAVLFANELSRVEGLELCYTSPGETAELGSLACRGYRLPTEAEWEFAARGGTSGPFFAGTLTSTSIDDAIACPAGDPVLEPLAWYCTNSGLQSHPVALKSPNPLGLYDVYKNVWEWVNDSFGTYPSGPQVDPLGPATTERKVRRGGSYRDVPRYSRSATRVGDWGPGHHYCIGFRIARTAS